MPFVILIKQDEALKKEVILKKKKHASHFGLSFCKYLCIHNAGYRSFTANIHRVAQERIVQFCLQSSSINMLQRVCCKTQQCNL